MRLEQKPHILADTVVQEVALEPWPCVSWVPKFPLYSNWPVMQGIWAVVTASSLSCSKKCCVALSEEGEGRGAYHLPGPGTSMFLAIGRGSQVTRGLPSWPVASLEPSASPAPVPVMERSGSGPIFGVLC